MIHRTRGDILKQDADALVNTVNCVGVMGRGVALQFRRAFEDNYEAYRKACLRQEVRPGQMFVFERSSLDSPRWIINFPTKRHWKGKSRLEDIRTGLVDLSRVIREKGIRSIALPPLGCGLGGLDWAVVRPLIEESLAVVSEVEVFLGQPPVGRGQQGRDRDHLQVRRDNRGDRHGIGHEDSGGPRVFEPVQGSGGEHAVRGGGGDLRPVAGLPQHGQALGDRAACRSARSRRRGQRP